MKINCNKIIITGAVAFTSAYYGQGFGPIQLDNVACVGTESRLLDCSHATSSCSHYEDAGVKCTGKLILLAYKIWLIPVNITILNNLSTDQIFFYLLITLIMYNDISQLYFGGNH